MQAFRRRHIDCLAPLNRAAAPFLLHEAPKHSSACFDRIGDHNVTKRRSVPGRRQEIA
jgi:hypothetical protein